MRKLLSIFLSICIVMLTLTCAFSVSVNADTELTEDEIAAKNYPVPDGYSLDKVYATYDTTNEINASSTSLYTVKQSTAEGTFYDVASKQMTTKNAWREIGATKSKFAYDSDGFAFWYQSEYSLMYRLRYNGSIIFYGSLPATTGSWVVYYNEGKMENGTINGSSVSKSLTSYAGNGDSEFALNFMFTTALERTVYVDEFFSFSKNEDVPDQTVVSAKNYPLEDGYQVNQLLCTYDQVSDRGTVTNSLYDISHSTEEGTCFDTGSAKITTRNAAREMSALSTAKTFCGDGFTFWYKSNYTVSFRLRMNNTIMIYGTLPASEGQWATYYYYGKAVNMSINSSSAYKNLTTYVNKAENTFKFNFMFDTAQERSVYVDEFLTFSAITTKADIYNNTNEFFKYSLKKLSSKTKTIANYQEDGSAVFTSEYGTTAASTPINVSYNLVSAQAQRAIMRAQSGSGYLKFSCNNISCLNSSGTDAYAKITLIINGIQKSLIKYSYGAGTSDEYLIDVSEVNPQNATSISLTISGSSLCNVQFELSPITVFYFPDDEMIIQAEDLNAKFANGGTTRDATIYIDADGNREYVAVSSYTSEVNLYFTLPELEVGEYDVYASCAAKTSYPTLYNISVNNRLQLYDVPFVDSTYASQSHNINIPVGTIKITKSYSDGASVLRMTNVPKSNAYLYVDYFSFKKTETQVEAEPSSNFEIKSYPEMDTYEVKTVLNNYDDYLCSGDLRYYKGIQTAGYVGDSTAYNLNSRGTVGKNYFDNNDLWYSANGLDGDGIRFWYKSVSSATLQFKSSSAVVYTKTLPATDGQWITIYYTDLVENGDLSNIIRLSLKTNSSTAYYIDELHTIQQKIGDVIYQVNDDNTASVVGYYLRLENVQILDEYEGCPVTTIEQGALSNTKTLKSITIPDSVTTIEDNVFENDLNLKTINFGNSVNTIGVDAFNNCPKIADVDMPSSLSSVDVTSFEGCDAIVMNVAPNSYIKGYALDNQFVYRSTSDNYKYLNDYNNVTLEEYLGNNKVIDMPDTIDGYNVTIIGEQIFMDNADITDVTIPENTTSINSEAFYNCSSLSNVTLNDSLLTIGDYAFARSTSLENITLPASITSIGTKAFNGCNTLVANVTKDSVAYTYVNENSIIQIPDTTSEYKYSLCNYNATIISYTGEGGDIVIPATIDGYKCIAVGQNAFYGNQTITSVTFPSENLKKVYEGAFEGCSNLTTFVAGSVNYIYSNAFVNCGITSLNLTNLVKYADDAFDEDVDITVTILQFARSAMDYCKDFTAGFNLGNTFESYNASKGYGTLTTLQSETLWGAPETTQAMINFIADSGFNLIRIPITWYAFIDTQNGYKIDQEYFDRIKQVVDWCMEKNMYVIINVHHDPWLDLSLDMDTVTEEFTAVWTQIAEQFELYDERLIFESMNEVRYGNDWYGQTDQILADYNSLNQAFYNVVRNSGGYNDVRYLMLETYGAQFGGRQINPFWIPSTTEDDHIIASIHMYNETTTESTYTPNFVRMYNAFTAKGIPCVIGETGIPCWDHYDDAYRVNWINCYMEMAESYGFKSIFWDDHGNYTLFNRSSLTWKYPLEIAQIMAVAENHSMS